MKDPKPSFKSKSMSFLSVSCNKNPELSSIGVKIIEIYFLNPFILAGWQLDRAARPQLHKELHGELLGDRGKFAEQDSHRDDHHVPAVQHGHPVGPADERQ